MIVAWVTFGALVVVAAFGVWHIIEVAFFDDEYEDVDALARRDRKLHS